MSDTVDTVDLNKPCDVLILLKRIRLRLIAGETEIRVRFGEDDVTFKPASMSNIESEIRRLQPECDKAEGRPVTRTRTAFKAGF